MAHLSTIPANRINVVELKEEIGGIVDTDGISITTNSSNSIQAVGVINQNNNSVAIKTWTGTNEEFDALVKEDDTLYNITDDTTVEAYEAYSKAETDGLLSEKADSNLNNVSITSSFATLLNGAGIRTVVETYRNGTSWYRVYSDGWREQGGLSGKGTITLIKPFTDTNYTCVAVCANQSGAMGTNSDTGIYVNSRTTTNFYANIGHQYSGSSSILWYACGY